MVLHKRLLSFLSSCKLVSILCAVKLYRGVGFDLPLVPLTGSTLGCIHVFHHIADNSIELLRSFLHLCRLLLLAQRGSFVANWHVFDGHFRLNFATEFNSSILSFLTMLSGTFIT